MPTPYKLAFRLAVAANNLPKPLLKGFKAYAHTKGLSTFVLHPDWPYVVALAVEQWPEATSRKALKQVEQYLLNHSIDPTYFLTP